MDPTHIARHLRSLRRLHLISHACKTVGDTLLWSCRGKGRGRFQVSYRRIADLAGCSPTTAQDAVRTLRRLGVLTWEQTHVRVSWRRLRGCNAYTFTSTSDWEAYRKQVSKKEAPEGETWRRIRPLPPIRSVQEQLRVLGYPGYPAG